MLAIAIAGRQRESQAVEKIRGLASRERPTSSVAIRALAQIGNDNARRVLEGRNRRFSPCRGVGGPGQAATSQRDGADVSRYG